MIEPMLCHTGGESSLDREGWAAEQKWDGTRAFLIKTETGFKIQNRRGVYYERRLPELTNEAETSNHLFIIDGEIVYFNSDGEVERIPCQRRCATQDLGKIFYLMSAYPVTFMAFDLLQWNGTDYRKESYRKRKDALSFAIRNMMDCPHIKYTEHVEGPAKRRLYDQVIERGEEGLIVKQVDSKYHCGIRSRDWLKIKPHWKEAICNVVGFTQGNGLRTPYFGALILSIDGQYAGKAGGGYNNYNLEKITKILERSPRTDPPFHILDPYTPIQTSLKVKVKYYKSNETGVFWWPSFLAIA